MNYKGLQKLSELYQKLKDLDAEIIVLDKLALQMATDKTSVDLTLKVLNVTKQEAEVKKNDEDDEHDPSSFLKKYMAQSIFSPFANGGTLGEKKEDDKHASKYSAIIDDISGIQIVGLLVMNKQELRSKIVNEIKSVKWGTVK